MLPFFFNKTHLTLHDNLNDFLRSIQYPGCIVFRETFICMLPTTASAAIFRVPRLFFSGRKKRQEKSLHVPRGAPLLHSDWNAIQDDVLERGFYAVLEYDVGG